ncbi:MAG: hypothetical protein R2755_28005 [Acidimicrobiales bacterium]
MHKDYVSPRALGWRTVRVRHAGRVARTVASGTDVEVELADLAGLPALIRVR